MRREVLVSLIIIVAQFFAAYMLYPVMPENMVIHWNINGVADGYGSRFLGLILLPVIQLILLPVFMALPRIDPKHGIEKFRGVYDWFIVGFEVFMAIIYGLGVTWNLGYRFNFSYLVAPVLGAGFYGVGELLSHAKMNWFVGIRTPWTLSSEEVWDRTHVLGGKLFKVCGLLSMLGLFLGGWVAFVFVFGSVLVSTIYLVAYSYVEYQKVEKKRVRK